MANQGGTKAERKEQARLERERIQQQMRARHRNRNIGLTLIAVALVAVVVVVFVMQPGKSNLSAPADLLAQAKAATSTAGCTAPQNIDPYNPESADGAHIGPDNPLFPTMPKLSTYPSTPPASGPHNPTPLPGGVYDTPPPIDQAIHSMEHAGAIVWYAPDAPSETIDEIKAFYNQKDNVGQTKVIVAPYNYPDEGAAGQLPAGTQMALVAWHVLQTCTQPNLAVALDFTSQYSNAADIQPYIGHAPEPNNTM